MKIVESFFDVFVFSRDSRNLSVVCFDSCEREVSVCEVRVERFLDFQSFLMISRAVFVFFEKEHYMCVGAIFLIEDRVYADFVAVEIAGDLFLFVKKHREVAVVFSEEAVNLLFAVVIVFNLSQIFER